jgi:hypothetical protein
MPSAKTVLGIVLAAVPIACDSPASPADAGASSASASAPAAVVTQALITLDDAHDLMKGGAGYSIGKASELVIEVGGHVFAAADGGPRGAVDAVHVAHGSAEYYRANWSGGSRITLNQAALDPVKGGPFAGFEPGDPYLVAVGREEPSNDGVMRFAPAWTTTVTVAPK